MPYNKFVCDAVRCVYSRKGNDVTIGLLRPTTYTVSKPATLTGIRKLIYSTFKKAKKVKLSQPTPWSYVRGLEV